MAGRFDEELDGDEMVMPCVCPCCRGLVELDDSVSDPRGGRELVCPDCAETIREDLAAEVKSDRDNGWMVS